jgi:uncharacterized paraquat-inducible protein A
MDGLIRAIFIIVVLIILFLFVILPRLRTLRNIEQEEVAIESQQDDASCPACGKPNPTDHSFCGFCGAELNSRRQGEEK